MDESSQSSWRHGGPASGMAVADHGLDGQVLTRLIDALHVGVIAIGADRTLMYANRAARRILRDGDAMIVVDGRLGFRKRTDEDRVGHWLRGAGQGDTHPPLGLARSTGRMPLLLHMATLSDAAGKPPAAKIVLVLDPESPARVLPPDLSAVFGLTRAEASLAAALANGECLGDYRDRAGIAPGTARRHLERAFLKAGVQRQTDLLRLVLACAPPLSDEVDDVANAPTPEIDPVDDPRARH